MRSHTTTSGKDTLGSRHTSEVFRRSLDTNHDYLLAILVPLLSIVSVEYDLTASSTWRSRETLSDDLSSRERQLIEYRMQKFIELLRLTAEDSSLLVDHTFVTCLEEPELAFLYGELHVLHIVIVVLQLILESVELLVKLRHSLFHRRILSYALLLRDASTLSPALRTDLCNLLWCADTSYHVLTLCIDKILTIEEVLTITCVTREANTSSRSFTHVTEYHRHDRNCSTPLIRNTFHLTVEDSALVHPRTEHCADSTPKLIDRIGREILTSLLLDSSLEELNELLERLYREVLVESNTLLFLHLFDDSLEWIDVFLVNWLKTHNNITIHLYETTI